MTPRANEKGLAARDDQTPEDTTNTHILADLDAGRKAYVTMQATAATAGCALYELSTGKFLLTRWGLSRELPDLRAVGALLAQLGGGV